MAKLWVFKHRHSRRDRFGALKSVRTRCVEQGEVQLVGDVVYRGGVGVKLEPQQANLVAALMLGSYVSHEDMANYLWPYVENQPEAWQEVIYQQMWMAKIRLAVIGITIFRVRGRGLTLEVA